MKGWEIEKIKIAMKKRSHHDHCDIELVLPVGGRADNFCLMVYCWESPHAAWGCLCVSLLLLPLGSRIQQSELAFFLAKCSYKQRHRAEESQPRKLIACHVALTNHIFMSVNESETYGWNFSAWCEQPRTPSSACWDNAWNAKFGTKIPSGKVGGVCGGDICILLLGTPPLSTASPWASTERQEVFLGQTTSHSLVLLALLQ